MITRLTDRRDLDRWVTEAWGDDDEPATLPTRQRAAADAIREDAYRAGVTWGDDWDAVLDALPDDWRER